MNYAHEYALLAAFAIPVLAVVGINVHLWWGGERGTLLVPSSAPLPTMAWVLKRVQAHAPLLTAAQQALAAANDSRERKAA
jgi:hypothetical protein